MNRRTAAKWPLIHLPAFPTLLLEQTQREGSCERAVARVSVAAPIAWPVRRGAQPARIPRGDVNDKMFAAAIHPWLDRKYGGVGGTHIF